MATATPTNDDLLKQLQTAADNNGNILCMQGDKPVYIPVAALLAKIQSGSGMSAEMLSRPDSLSLLGQVQSFADLRAMKPSTDGMRVSLRGWNANTRLGGGEFIARLNAKAADDGGIIASSGQNWYWERVVEDPSRLDVTHFGAIPDGKTDCVNAVMAMFKWSQAKYPQIGIRFPSGTFFLSQFKYDPQIAFFKVAGTFTTFGYFATTTLVSNTDANVLFDVQARWTELSGITFNGGNQGITDLTKWNKKGFYNNRIIEGQFINIHCIRFQYVGGTCIQMIDTLDTKIDQWYASHCNGDVIAATWSNSPKGAWDHVTAIELSNFNAQQCTTGKVLNLPRATQCFITNGWIEHTEYPGDLSNGQWIINGFNMEDCKNPMRGNFARIINNQQGLQSGASWDWSENPPDIERWLSLWERGRVDINNYGIYVEGSLDVTAYGSRNKLNNNSDKTQWFYLGKFYSPQQGDSIDINMVGCGNNLSVTPTLDKLDDVRQGGGNTLIRLQLLRGGLSVSHQPCGSSPILGVKYVFLGNGQTQVYVQLKPYTYNIIPMVTFTGKTHFEAGVSIYWIPSRTAMAESDVLALPNILDSRENWSIGQKAGVGASDEGVLLLKSKMDGKNLVVKIEGKLYSVALTDYKDTAK